MELSARIVELPLRYPFRISRGVTRVQPTVIATLDDGECAGVGEACPSSYYGVTAQSILSELHQVAARGVADHWSCPHDLYEQLVKFGVSSFARCAVDTAAWDLYAKRMRRPLLDLFGLHLAAAPPSDYTIGIDTPEMMRRKAAEYADWPALKVKVGGPRDLEGLRAIREVTAARFRVDANGGWTLQTARRLLPELWSLNVELIEQPLPPRRRDDQRTLFEESPLPLFADESCVGEHDVAGCVGLFHGVNIKLVKCGGLTPARRMMAEARRRGLKLMIGCMTESSVGCAAAASLAPLVDYVDLDGPLLIAKDVGRPLQYRRGRISLEGCRT